MWHTLSTHTLRTIHVAHTIHPHPTHHACAGRIARNEAGKEGLETTVFVDMKMNNFTFEFLERYDMGMEYIIRKYVLHV